MSVSNSNAVNSDYCNVNDQSKDCYLISASEWNEKVMYSNRITHDKDSSDFMYLPEASFVMKIRLVKKITVCFSA